MNPCEFALAFNASEAELAVFQERIEAWSQRKDLSSVVEAATELRNSVLFKDSQGYLEAEEKFRRATNSLSEKARRGFREAQRRQDQEN